MKIMAFTPVWIGLKMADLAIVGGFLAAGSDREYLRLFGFSRPGFAVKRSDGASD